MEIRNEGEAREAVEAIAKWLSRYREPIPEDEIGTGSETRAALLAREFCDDFLTAGDADGVGECRLCQL